MYRERFVAVLQAANLCVAARISNSVLLHHKQPQPRPTTMFNFMFRRRAADETWHEVLVLLSGLLSYEPLYPCVNVLLEMGHVELALSCLEQFTRRDETNPVESRSAPLPRVGCALSPMDPKSSGAGGCSASSLSRCGVTRRQATCWRRPPSAASSTTPMLPSGLCLGRRRTSPAERC
jgi:hypothetical protein